VKRDVSQRDAVRVVPFRHSEGLYHRWSLVGANTKVIGRYPED
jgi:hypothetical protein